MPAYLLLTIAPLCWGGNIVLARGIYEIMPPVAFAFWRWAIAFLLLLPFTWRPVRRDFSTAVRHWKIISLLAFFGVSCFNTLLYKAMHTTTAINGALIQTTMPAVIILITLLFFKEIVSKLQLFGVLLCVMGAATVVLRGQWQLFTQMTLVEGDLLMAIAVVAYALYSALLRKRPAMHPMSFLVYTFGIGALMLLPLYLAGNCIRKHVYSNPEYLGQYSLCSPFPLYCGLFLLEPGYRADRRQSGRALYQSDPALRVAVGHLLSW